jgi:hypothetical protein
MALARGATHRALHQPREYLLAVVLAVGVALVLGECGLCALLEGGVYYGRDRLLDDIRPAVNLDLMRAGVGALVDDIGYGCSGP